MDKETIKATVSAAVVIIVNVRAIWHNHYFTQAAQQVQMLTDAIKAGDEPDAADDLRGE